VAHCCVLSNGLPSIWVAPPRSTLSDALLHCARLRHFHRCCFPLQLCWGASARRRLLPRAFASTRSRPCSPCCARGCVFGAGGWRGIALGLLRDPAARWCGRKGDASAAAWRSILVLDRSGPAREGGLLPHSQVQHRSPLAPKCVATPHETRHHILIRSCVPFFGTLTHV
jgi:hypothetical protein